MDEGQDRQTDTPRQTETNTDNRYKQIQTETNRDGQIQTEPVAGGTDRQTDRQTYRQTSKKADGHIEK